jgi:hypothetical protein
MIGFRKSVGSLRYDLDQEALEGIFGFFKVAYEYMVYFANFQHFNLCQTYFLAQPN